MEPAAYSVDEFCSAHSISRSMFYKICGLGLGPRIMRIGTRRMISRESAADWRRLREMSEKTKGQAAGGVEAA
jgi:hypothetical protein